MSKAIIGYPKLQVIVAAMHQDDYRLLIDMNIQSDAIICNQCSRDSREEFVWSSHNIVYINSSQIGVGRNRNQGILEADGDILLFADEDVRYYDDYVQVVKSAYERCPDADMIFFNLKRINDQRNVGAMDSRDGRVYRFNCLRYGAVRISIKRSALLRANVWFSLLFGGGATFSFGEDSLFIFDLLRKGIRAYASEKEIGIVDQSHSTWFSGYDDKYFYDKGALFCALSKRFFLGLAMRYLVKHRNEFRNQPMKRVFKNLVAGRKAFLKID